MRKPVQTLLGFGLISVMTVGLAAPAHAIPADTPIIGPYLPPAFQRYTEFDDVSRTYTNPEGGKVHHEIVRSGFYNSSPLFGTDRNADLTLEVKNKISYKKFEKAFYYAGVQFGCQMGIGNTSLKVYANSGTKLTVNGKVSASARTEPIADFISQSIKTATDIAIATAVAAAGAGPSEGASAALIAKAAIRNAVPQAVTTWNLQDTVSTASQFDSKVSVNPNAKPVYKQTYQAGRLTEIPFFLLRYSPGMNQVRLSGLSLRAEGCAGLAKIRPFVRTIGKTKSGNYVDYSTFGQDYLFVPNKFFRMDT